MVGALQHFLNRFSCVCNVQLSFMNSFDLLNCWDLGSLLYVFISPLFLSFTIFLLILGKIFKSSLMHRVFILLLWSLCSVSVQITFPTSSEGSSYQYSCTEV